MDVSLTVVAAHLQLDKNPTHHRVRKAIERGFLVNNETAKGRPLKLCIGDPIPDTTEILPDINSLRSRCTVVVDPGGDTRENAESEEDGLAGEAGASPPFIPQNSPQHYNSAPSDFDAVAEEGVEVQSAQLTNGKVSPPFCAQCGAADPGPMWQVNARRRADLAAPRMQEVLAQGSPTTKRGCHCLRADHRGGRDRDAAMSDLEFHPPSFSPAKNGRAGRQWGNGVAVVA
jgi:hypothetical protein